MNDTVLRQTIAVIDKVVDAANIVARMLARYADTAKSKRIGEDIAEASERLINLLSLAEARIEGFGCGADVVGRLCSIDASVKASARRMLESDIVSQIEHGSRILTGKHGMPFGIGAMLTRRMERIGRLLKVCGGFSALDERWRESLSHGIEITNDAVVMEANAMAMPNFQMPEYAKGSRKRIGSIGNACDQKLMAMAMEKAAEVSQAFDLAVDAGRIRLRDIVDDDYVLIAGTTPRQYMSKFTALTDQLLPPIQEPALKTGDRVSSAVAIDRNGYLPTHHRQYSFPQRDGDLMWNATHCRNRRLRDDHTLLNAVTNETPILLQTFLRDMGADVTIMRTASAPISVKGRHWGGFCVGYGID